MIQVLIKPSRRREDKNEQITSQPSPARGIRYNRKLNSKIRDREYSLNKHISEIRERALQSRNSFSKPARYFSTPSASSSSSHLEVSATGYAPTKNKSGLIDFHPDILFDAVGADKNSNATRETVEASLQNAIVGSSSSQGNAKDVLDATLSCLYRCDLSQSFPGKAATEDISNPEAQKVNNKKLQRLLPRHPNLLPMHGIVEGSKAYYLISSWKPYSLLSVLRFSADALQRQETKLFLVFQLLHCVQFLHSRGITHGSISPAKLFISNNLWLTISGISPYSANLDLGLQASLKASQKGSIPRPISMHTSSSETCRWIRGEISNFDYLMYLNRLAGRISGGAYPSYHPVFPWVVDFTEPPPRGFRDLTKTKFRLKKGDEQLDFT